MLDRKKLTNSKLIWNKLNSEPRRVTRYIFSTHWHAIACLFLSSCSMARKKSHKFPIQLIELEDENYHILIETEFQNGVKGKWAIDTGASKSVFDENQNELYQIKPILNTEVQSAGIGEMQIDTQPGILPLLKIGNLTLKDWPVAIIDLQYVNKLYHQFAHETIFGLLGSDFLVQHQAKIDYKKLVLTLYF